MVLLLVHAVKEGDVERNVLPEDNILVFIKLLDDCIEIAVT